MVLYLHFGDGKCSNEMMFYMFNDSLLLWCDFLCFTHTLLFDTARTWVLFPLWIKTQTLQQVTKHNKLSFSTSSAHLRLSLILRCVWSIGFCPFSLDVRRTLIVASVFCLWLYRSFVEIVVFSRFGISSVDFRGSKMLVTIFLFSFQVLVTPLSWDTLSRTVLLLFCSVILALWAIGLYCICSVLACRPIPFFHHLSSLSLYQVLWAGSIFSVLENFFFIFPYYNIYYISNTNNIQWHNKLS